MTSSLHSYYGNLKLRFDDVFIEKMNILELFEKQLAYFIVENADICSKTLNSKERKCE